MGIDFNKGRLGLGSYKSLFFVCVIFSYSESKQLFSVIDHRT